MSVVVSDTSPLRCLAHLNLLQALPSLFRSVLVPPAVVSELSVAIAGLPVIELVALPFVRVVAPADAEMAARLRLRLHRGESEALALAVEVRPEAVLIDEKTGRAIAKELGLKPLGVLGTLVRAKHAGLIAQVAPLVTRLRRELDFRVSSAVERRVLALAGE